MHLQQSFKFFLSGFDPLKLISSQYVLTSHLILKCHRTLILGHLPPIPHPYPQPQIFVTQTFVFLFPSMAPKPRTKDERQKTHLSPYCFLPHHGCNCSLKPWKKKRAKTEQQNVTMLHPGMLTLLGCRKCSHAF